MYHNTPKNVSQNYRMTFGLCKRNYTGRLISYDVCCILKVTRKPMGDTMNTKSTILIATSFIFLLTLKVQALISVPYIESLACEADCVVIGKYLSSVEIKDMGIQTYKIDKFMVEKILILKKGKYFSTLNERFLISEKKTKPNPVKIFAMIRLADRGIGHSPPIQDPKFKKGSNYLLVINHLYNDQFGGMYVPLRTFQDLPLATEETVNKVMKKYEEFQENRKKILKKSNNKKSIKVPGVKTKNVVIVSQEKFIAYRDKCQHCGFLLKESGLRYSTKPRRIKIEFICPKCDKITEGSIETGTENDKLFPLLDTDEFSGVVVPLWYDFKFCTKVDEKVSWIPTISDIKKSENCIEKYFKSLKVPKIEYESLEYIKKNLKKYRRQYVGFKVNGEKRIFCNFFPEMKEGKKDHFPSWRKHITGKMDVDGGGASFWSIVYCINKDKCIGFDMNAPE